MLKSKNKKIDEKDDGQTVADMNVEGFSWYQSKKTMKHNKEMADLNLGPKERRAVIKGAFMAYLPTFLIILGSFLIAYLLFTLWVLSVG